MCWGRGVLATLLIWRLPDAVRRTTSVPGSRAWGEDVCASDIQGRCSRGGREGSGMGQGLKLSKAGAPAAGRSTLILRRLRGPINRLLGPTLECPSE